MLVNLRIIFCLAVTCLFLCGCDPVTRYTITSTIFDGVPRMPPAEEYCQEYHQKALAEEAVEKKKKQLAQQKAEASIHPPYAEKSCDDCHDKNTDSGFITPLKTLCASCHGDLLKEAQFVHGPTAVGACLKCHEPHSAPNQKLLVRMKAEICVGCHIEPRISKGLHDNVFSQGIICTDCHDPHAANNRYLLR